MGGGLAGDDLLGEVHRVVHRNGEPDAGVVAGIRGDQRVDADELALVVHKRAAGVARVDGRVGLDHVRIDSGLAAAAGLHRLARVHDLRAARGGHDARGHRLLEPEGGAQGHDPLADGQVVRIADLHGGEAAGILGLQHRHVGGGIGAHQLGVVGVAGDGHLIGAAAVDHVVVGDEVAVLGHHDARAGTQALELAARIGVGLHVYHGRQALGGHGLSQGRVIFGVDGSLGSGRAARGLGGGGVDDGALHAEREHAGERGAGESGEEGAAAELRLGGGGVLDAGGHGAVDIELVGLARGRVDGGVAERMLAEGVRSGVQVGHW